ncbi:MAG: hypothetical protein WCY68_14490 [Desulfuromonadales bacterium]
MVEFTGKQRKEIIKALTNLHAFGRTLSADSAHERGIRFGHLNAVEALAVRLGFPVMADDMVALRERIEDQ